MGFDLDISAVDRFLADWQRAADDIGAGMRTAVEAGLVAGEAAARSLAPKVTGRLASSIGHRVDRADGRSASGTVSTDGRMARYDKYVLEGTLPHAIEARSGGVLAFNVGGSTVFAKRVQHPGTKAQDFITPAAEPAEARLEAEADRVVAAALAKVGA
jgi:hypothetical protein